jgi:hypothetical protein
MNRLFCRNTILMVIALTLMGSMPAYGDQDPGDEQPAVDTPDALAEKKNKKTKDPNRGRFLPIPIFITEPAIGDGLGLALVYFHRAKDAPDKETFASPGSIGQASKEQTPPPTLTGVFGAYTSNETAAGGIGHMNSFRDDHIRFAGVVGLANVNSTFYVLDQPFKFNLEGFMAYQETRFRIADSRWFLGIGLSYLDASSAFQEEPPEDVPVDLFRTDLRNSGLAAKLAWDTRDNTPMPNRGQLFELTAWRYDEAIGGDFDYWNGKLKLLSFHPLHEKFVLGLRFEYSAIDGKAPFFAIPWITLRGIPALRYQGDRVGVAEVEGRYNILPRWAVIGFAGRGSVSSDVPIIDTEQRIYAYGLGGRYKIFEAQNVWVGIDIARGPEDTNYYIQVGHAW